MLFASGTPTASQIAASFINGLNGAIDATAFRVSSQLALLPGATDRLVAQVQNNLLGNAGSLASRIDRCWPIPAQSGAHRLLDAINQAINRQCSLNSARRTNFLRTAPLNRLSIDPTTGQRIPLQQFMAQQVVSQFGNTLGSLASSFPTVANTAIFNNGTISTDPAVQQTFANQLAVGRRGRHEPARQQPGRLPQ